MLISRKRIGSGRGTPSFLHDAAVRLRNIQLEMSARKEARIAVLETHRERIKEVHYVQQVRFDAGRISIQDLNQSKYYLLEAEMMLARAKNADK